MKLRIQITLVAALAATAALAVPPGHEWAPDPFVAPPTEALSSTPCIGGTAGPYPCERVDLLAFLPLAQMGCVGGNPSGNDIWGWTDPLTGNEYALMGCHNGTSFVDLSDPTNPVYIGRLPTQTSNSQWRDVKVYADHAFVVSEAPGHGLQVFDLNELRNVTDPPVVFQATAHLASFSRAHNIAINEDTGYAYVVGSNQCSGGLHIVDIQTPAAPTVAGCFSADGYTHDTQCVIYQGPDTSHQGSEICFNSNVDTLTIVDVTDKSAPVMLGRETYAGVGYAHQGWLTEDQHYFLLDDEHDEQQLGHNTRTRIWDVSDLASPEIIGIYDSSAGAIDHNQYVKGSYVYQSNYTAGLRILDLAQVADGELTEVAYFDTYPANDNPTFNGSWSNYPYFDSGIVIASGIGEGLFVLQPVLAEGVIEGVVIGSDTSAPLEGAEVRAVGVSTRTATTGSDGAYQITVPAGTYAVTASLDGYFPETASGVEVPEEGTVVVGFALDSAPIAAIAPASFAFVVPQGGGDGDILSIGNTGGTGLDWSLTTDVPGLVGDRTHDPALDEAFEVPTFTVQGGQPVVEVPFEGGVASRGEVLGFSFVGTVSGISGSGTWASDTCMVVEAPDGTIYGVGGFGSPTISGCGIENAWDFQGSGSTNDGTYTSGHDGAFDPSLEDQGEWKLRFVMDFATGVASTWTGVTVTLHKAPLPVCGEATTPPAWLSAIPDSGTTPPGETSSVNVTVDTADLPLGSYEAALCVATSAPGTPLAVVPVQLTVTKAGGKTHLVTVQNFEFVPASLAIEVGDTVQWENVDGFHNVVADDGSFDSGPPVSAPWTFTHTFDGKGVFPYYCAPHGGPGGVGMAAEIIVGEPVPELTFDPPSLEFGDVEVGETSPAQMATLANTGSGPATGLAFDLSGGDGFAFDASACGGSLPADESCEVTVTFAPAEAGPAAATLQAGSAEGASAALGLAGNGVDPEVPELAFSPTDLDFGEVEVGETSAAQMATLTNTGSGPATGLAFDLSGGDGFAFDASGCGGSLPADESCEVTVTFTPTEAGPAAATLQAGSAEGASAALGLAGNGVDPEAPELAFSPAELDFGVVEVGTTSSAEVSTLSNVGDGDADELVFDLSGDGVFDADSSDCGDQLVAGQTCEVVVTFTPSETGPATATLLVNSTNGASASVDLSGQGVGAGAPFSAIALEVDPEALASDGNSVLEPGEQVEVAPAWRNDEVEARDLTGTAADFTGPAGAQYTLVLDAADYGTLGAGQVASCRETGSCYQVSVDLSGERPATHWEASFEETLSDESVKSWTLHIGESFSDVPRTSPFYRFVETLLHGGVTSGCTGFEYCPAAVNNRAQMAVFLLRALQGPDYAPPACVPSEASFADVPATSPFCAWIEELARREVTGGCGEGLYCPADPVNRAQMAVFLLRTLEGPAYTPPACVGSFADLPCTSPFAPWVEDLAARQVTGGCATDPPRYCPADPVSRAQMAVFLTATFDLGLYDP